MDRSTLGWAELVGATGWGGASGTHNNAKIGPRKLTASIQKAGARPQCLMANPAGAGPIIVLSCAVPSSMESAASYCSGRTRDGSSAVLAGNEKASVTPKAQASP